MRQEVERKIAEALINQALAAGYTISVVNDYDADPDEYPIIFNTCEEVLAAMFQTDEDHLYMWKDSVAFGWVYFVYGSDGWDVISDYTTNLDHIMSEANAISNHYAD
jgi:hypothetical protein